MPPTSDAERARAYRARKESGESWKPKPCGTVAAARRHQRAGETLCAPCARVWAEHQAEQYRKRKR